ncbi:hypothetical protein BT69DRAFT_1297823 [Atractiella rhizophila]|nr:hypothetical protein BT69DRAFT_1297823 [Atractiella rhizophila]
MEEAAEEVELEAPATRWRGWKGPLRYLYDKKERERELVQSPSRSKRYWRFNFGRGGTSLLPFYAFTLCIACCTARSTEERQLGELSAEAEMELDNVRTMLLAKSRTNWARRTGGEFSLDSSTLPAPFLSSSRQRRRRVWFDADDVGVNLIY